MKLYDLSFGDVFELNRSGDHYVLLGKQYWKGKATSRYVVSVLSKVVSHAYQPKEQSLNGQCSVTKIGKRSIMN